MKNGMLIWNVVLSVVAGVLLFLQFGTKKKTAASGKSTHTDSTGNQQFRIAYFEMDSLENNFNVVKDVKGEISIKETDYNNNVAQLDEAYKKKFQELSKENMTPEEVATAENTLRQYGETLKSRRADLDQNFQDFIMRKNLDVKKKIEEFIKEFNKTKGYSFIVTDDTGLFFYKDTAYNITADLIRGLNDHYKQIKK